MEKNQSENRESSKANEKMLEEEDTNLFEKTSTKWKEYESMDAFKRTPQRPHFSPLIKKPSIVREDYALIIMETWLDISEALHTPGTDVSLSQLETLLHLETHGFDVDELLLLTMYKGLKQANTMEEQKGKWKREENLTSTAVVDLARKIDKVKDLMRRKTEVATKLEKVRNDKRDLVAEILELEERLRVAEKRVAELREKKEAVDKEIADLQSC
ncbi:DUF724 domain-containing protein 5-like [Eutrema salsugineum]|uniref:DUF724 domain-containing protein 5-like n=1 Tax=Eutrema salsugineum TaxID=72664 RepID=UPI000CED7CAC|nr:DUF724 domain-containing protein 5-like [Eutrema salsugineum]